MRKITGTLGNYYPFFLNNSDLTSYHYLYQLYSPKLDEKTLTPYVSLTKVSEKTVSGPHMSWPEGTDLDLLRVCTGRRELNEQEAAEYLDTISKGAWGKMHFDLGSGKMPYVELTDNQFYQRTLITVYVIAFVGKSIAISQAVLLMCYGQEMSLRYLKL